MFFISPFNFPLDFLSNFNKLKPHNLRKTEQKSFYMKKENSDVNKIDNSEWLNSILLQEKQKNSLNIHHLRKIGNNILKNTNFPSKKDESWRFTKLDRLFGMKFVNIQPEVESEFTKKYFLENSEGRCVFVNGVFFPNLFQSKNDTNSYFLGKFSDLEEKEKEKIRDLAGKGESGINGGFFPILNMANLDEIAVLVVKAESKIKDPIQILFASSTNKNPICINQKLIIVCEKKSSVKIIQHHVGNNESEFFDNSTTNVLVDEGAQLDFFLINQVPEQASNFNSIHADLRKSSSFNFLSTSFGGFLSRISLGIDLNGINASCNVEGITVVKNSQISDIHSRISHNYPLCKSSQLHKNLISDKGHAIFAGKVQVHNGAYETESNQLCKSLLLSQTSKVDSMPILEINNEDVKCTHGSTVSDLDQEQLFYFKSRGIPVEKARFLLTIGFIKEIIEKLPKELNENLSQSVNNLIKK
uniref:SUF system FeS cluster assembly SufBD core domain-containing protein n=1 Tax=Hemiselmis tepida TaxID=464990 RepID=A0A7S0VXI3_9CRYP|mmetsp:Transcript_28246/g.71533  ORF Transcript_28246/g.71533 Transcript_28246/m.71533 type:complete len:472 (+) Transcript_28246:54-1469(+)